MGEWVLILTLMAGMGSAMTSVPGFATKAECEAAGVVWRESVANMSNKERFACVQRSNGSLPQS